MSILLQKGQQLTFISNASISGSFGIELHACSGKDTMKSGEYAITGMIAKFGTTRDLCLLAQAGWMNPWMKNQHSERPFFEM